MSLGATLPGLPDQQMFYRAVGRCIYCGTESYSGGHPRRKLGKEHIIPESLGGSLILPEASCSECEAITSSFERTVARTIFGPLRLHYNLPTKRRSGRPETLEVFSHFVDNADVQVVDVPIAEHPLMCAVAILNPPRLLAPPNGGERNFIAIFPEGMEQADRQASRLIKECGASKIETEASFARDEFVLVLAKIAHAACLAWFGDQSFQTLLPQLIRLKDGNGLGMYVGACSAPRYKGGSVHHLAARRVARGNQWFLVVEVGLFAGLGLPCHDVIVGRLYDANPLVPQRPRSTRDP